MNKEQLLSLGRHVLTFLGTFLIGKSLWGIPIMSETVDILVGVIMTLAGIGFSIYEKNIEIEKLQGLARQVITAIGGLFVARGTVTNEDIEKYVAIAMAIIPFLQSILARKKARRLETGNIDVRTLKGTHAAKTV